MVLEKACFQQRGFEFFKNILMIKNNVEHEKLKEVQTI